MSFSRIAGHVVILIYLTITFCAFVLTMSQRKVILPIAPYDLIVWSYGMMAPYQGYTTTNDDFFAYGKRPDGTYEKIDIDAYYPMSLGERNVRRHLLSFKNGANNLQQRKYKELAGMILAHEREKGRDYQSVEISYQYWPCSPEGYYALYKPLFVHRRKIAEAK